MSTSDTQRSGNAEGRYSITDECDGCGICVSYSAYSFAASEDGARCFVARQPEAGSEEEAIVRDAMAACPLGCIRDDSGRH
jgi:ferredoxin